ncbi:hypothetical protein ES703_23048 [subsurface metagenome]
MWSGPFLDIGLLNRLFLVPGSAQRRFSFPDVIPEEKKQYFAKSLQSILAFADMKKVYDLTPDAKELFDYDSGFDPDQPSLVSSFRDEDPEDFIR